MLAIQTEWQELYEQYSSSIMCIDSTHGTNAYHSIVSCLMMVRLITFCLMLAISWIASALSNSDNSFNAQHRWRHLCIIEDIMHAKIYMWCIWGVISPKMLNFFWEGESAFFYLLWVIISISKHIWHVNMYIQMKKYIGHDKFYIQI